MNLGARIGEGRLLLGFIAVGAIGFVTDAGLLYVGLALGLSHGLARALSIIVALQVTFLLNGLLVFRRLTPRLLARQWAAYMLSNGFGAGCNYLIYQALLASRLPVLSEGAAPFVAAAALAMGVNYMGTRFLAFRRVADRG